MADFKQNRIVLPLRGSPPFSVAKDIVYRRDAERTWLLDCYQPVHADAAPRPAILFIHGEAPPDLLFDAKDWGQYASWAQLAAQSGFVGITFTHRSSRWFTHLPEVEADIAACWHYLQANGASLGIDTGRIGVWVCSGGTPAAMAHFLRNETSAKCLTVCYGRMSLDPIAGHIEPQLSPADLDHVSAIKAIAETSCPPLLLIRCGADQLEGVNSSIDAFVATATAANLPFELINHPTAGHAFDVSDDDERSRQIIRRIISFNQAHLMS